MREEALVGVVLAAGSSSRFGSPKQLLPFGDSTLLGQVVRNAAASRLERVVVVLGRAADEVRHSIDFDRAEIADNRDFGGGCASSLQAGLAHAGESAGLMLLLGDQPGVSAGTIDHVIEAWNQTRPWAALTVYRGEPGHPFVFSHEAFSDLRRLRGEKAIWKLMEDHSERVSRIDVDFDLPPDVDTPDDYERALGHWQRMRGATESAP